MSRNYYVVGSVWLIVVIGFFLEKHHSIVRQFLKNASQSAGNPSASGLPHQRGNIVQEVLAYSVCKAFDKSVPIFWKHFESEIKEAAVSKATFWPEEQRNNTKFHEWIDQLFQDHYQSYQLQRSSIHPPGLEVTLKTIEIISKRVQHLNDPTLPAAPPLHIMVTGGSLVSGMACGINHVDLMQPGHLREYKECAWPVRLEHLFNSVLFHGQDVVKVSNLAAGGSDSKVGKIPIEYHLFPEGFQIPDIVIWSHAANDAQQMKGEDKWSELDVLTDYINAAHNLRVCDENLPMVVMNEEFFGQDNDISGDIYKASNWFGVMGISQRNVISHKIFANLDNDDYVKGIVGALTVHVGMGGHIGVAWTVFYNFISAFTNACDFISVSSSPPGTLSHHNHFKSIDVKEKSIGPYRETDRDKIPLEWVKHQKGIDDMCSKSIHNAFISSNGTTHNTLSRPCTWAFMVNKMTPELYSSGLKRKMREVLTFNKGWNAEGKPVQQPRTGFYAKEPNARFSLKIDVSIETNYLTIVSMKSYGPNFIDTHLNVDVIIKRKGGTSASSDDRAEYEVEGYHEEKTSIHVPHKFELPNGGARGGDIIVVNFHLTNGNYFKIAGLAFCRY